MVGGDLAALRGDEEKDVVGLAFYLNVGLIDSLNIVYLSLIG